MPRASKPTKACYLAGPMRGRGRRRVLARFGTAATRLRALGWRVLNPAEHDAKGEEALATIVRRDLALVTSLRPKTEDAIVLLPGYELSDGARAELAVARWLKLRLLLYEEALLEEEGDEVLWQ